MLLPFKSNVSTLLWLALLVPATVYSAAVRSEESDAATVSTVTRFGKGIWPETIAARSNGQLLVTRWTNHPAVYLVDPLAPPTQNTRVVASFPQYNGKQGVGGLVEIRPDIFAIIIGNSRYDDTVGHSVFESGLTEVYTLDFSSKKSLKPVVKQLTTIRGAGFLNGLTIIPKSKYMLSADSVKGVVYRIDSVTGAYKIAIADKSMAPPPNATIPLGINGIQVNEAGNTVYFDNSAGMTFARVPIHPDGTASGPVQQITSFKTFTDDFVLGGNVAYVATNPGNSVLRVSLTNGKTTTIAGGLNSTDVPGGTSITFGRTSKDKNTLYVSCNGGLATPVNGTYVEASSVKAVKL